MLFGSTPKMMWLCRLLAALAVLGLLLAIAQARTADLALTVTGDERMAEELKTLTEELDKDQPRHQRQQKLQPTRRHGQRRIRAQGDSGKQDRNGGQPERLVTAMRTPFASTWRSMSAASALRPGAVPSEPRSSTTSATTTPSAIAAIFKARRLPRRRCAVDGSAISPG